MTTELRDTSPTPPRRPRPGPGARAERRRGDSAERARARSAEFSSSPANPTSAGQSQLVNDARSAVL